MTSINVDQQLGLIVAPGSPAVAVDQSLGLIVAPSSPAVATDQFLALIVEQRLSPQIIFNYLDQQLALIVERRTNTSFTFLDPSGAPVANGTLELRLSQDASANGKQVTAKCMVVATLDITGSCNLNLWTNDILLPSGTCYRGEVKTSQGLPVWKAQFTIATGGIVTYL